MAIADTIARAVGQQLGFTSIGRRGAVACLIAAIFVIFRLLNGADTPFLAFSVIGAAVVHLTNRPRLGEIAFTLGMAVLLAIAYARSGGVFGGYFGAGVVSALAFLGLASTLVLGWKASRDRAALRPVLLATFCPALVIVSNFALVATLRFQPRVFDLFLIRFDGLLGLQPSFMVGQWFAASPFLSNACFLIYSSLPLAEVLVVLLFFRGNRMPANPLIVFMAAGLAGFLLYQVCPAAGPVHVFGAEFPKYPPGLLPLQSMQLDDAPRNAIPSLHSVWAILILWNVRYCRWWIRCLAAVFLALTLLATLGLGEHYLIDLVIAVPFAAAALAVCIKQFARALGAGVLTLGWLVYLRFGLATVPLSPIQAWIAILATVAIGAAMVSARTLPTRTLQIPASSGIPSAHRAE